VIKSDIENMDAQYYPDITRIIVLFRNDLRLNDNYALRWAINFKH